MPERPLLILPSPGAPLARQKGRGFGGEKFQRPSVERQKERLSPQFKRLQQAFDERRVRLQTESRDLVPEEVIVLETVGAVDDFMRAVERVPGMEWLAEVEVEGIPPDDDFFATADDGETRLDKDLRGRVFLVFSDQDALKYMMSLWKTWQSGDKLPYRLGKWKWLFRQVRELRHWGIQDRLLETGIFDDWRQRVKHGQEVVQCEAIQFFRAAGQMSVRLADEFQDQDREAMSEEPPAGSPVVAMFDGLPLQAHRRLQGRLVVDDPDGFEADSPPLQRQHGTAMASLILHGDLAASEVPLARSLYVRPILRPHDWANAETMPEGTLVVDLIHRAVRRLFEGDGNEAPVAPHVAIVNLSIGIRDRPFDLSLSPLTRLLDWLAWRYKVLFVVSAGNHGNIDLSAVDRQLFGDSQEDVIRSVSADARHRRLLSPAEAVNALTVASVHEDASTEEPPPGWDDPFTAAGLPSPINAQGMGHRRGIKPDVLAAGGRVVVQQPKRGGAAFELYGGSLPPGQRVASPGANPGDRGAIKYSRGTSNATALVSRACGLLYDVLDELRAEPWGETIDAVPRAIWLKAIVAHGAEWGRAGAILTQVLKNKNNSRQFKEYVTRFLGYGVVNIDRVQECTAQRVTALGGGRLRQDQSHILRFPLPPSLQGKRGHRRLTITLAWLSPVNPRHQAWRRAALSFDPPQDPIKVRRQQADWRAVRRGTLQHEILEGQRAAVFVEGADLEIQVSCRAGAGSLEEEVPYALATTLEVAEELGIDIYDEVRGAVHAVPVRPDVDA